MQLLIGLAVLIASAAGASEMHRQCLCTEAIPCFEKAPDEIEKCADKCKSHVTNMGASYPAAKQCVLAHKERALKAMACGRAAFEAKEMPCAEKPGAPEIKRRFPETIQLAAFREITTMLSKSGLLADATQLVQLGRRATGCMNKCAQAHPCVKMGCSLKLPTDNEIVAVSKKCAIDAGFTTPLAIEICECLAKAGIKQLTPLCPRIVIQ